MRKNLFFIIISSLLILSSCSDEQEPIRADKPQGTINVPLTEEYVKSGVIRVKLTEEAEAKLNITTGRSGEVLTGVASLDALSSSIHITKIKKTFGNGGKFEARRRKAGLHLWYDIYFDNTQPMSRAFSTALNLPDATVVEPIMKAQRIKTGSATPLSQAAVREIVEKQNKANSTLPKTVMPFNDPFLKYQWHYHNEGKVRNSLPAADINLLKAWQIETGKPQVIVAIIDGGIEPTHPDLVANLWTNTKEVEGNNYDDDQNNYTDDVHGYNFVFPNDNDWQLIGKYGNASQGKVTGHEHGTHVAGTVAAVNNNGAGGAGVAGGNGNPDSGIRLMSCQIFAYDEEGAETGADDNRGNAFLYAAENGAVIAQNSWSYTWTGTEMELMEADKEAIDYFIDNAGMDENGEQVGPMKGGIVIFAAGNDNVNAHAMPSSYERVFSVSSFGPDYKKAVYSNYGDWVEVSAPGGDGDYAQGSQIFSTFLQGQYGFMEGTSMACPHVSGIAALVVSKYGVDENGNIKPFTNEELKAKLLNSTNDMIGWYNPASYPMGKGYVNAYKALADYGELAPDRVGDMHPVWFSDKVKISWQITADADAALGKAYGYKIYISEEDQYGLDFSRLMAPTAEVLTGSKAVGETLSYEAGDLEMGKIYSISIAAFDEDGHYSLSSTIQGEPIANRAPVVEGMPDAVSLRKDEQKEVVLNVYDIEDDAWEYSFEAGSKAVGITKRADGKLALKFDASAETPGSTFEATLKVWDVVNPENVNEISLSYSIINNAPVLLQNFQDVLFHYVGETKEYKLDNYFVEKDNDPITYEVSSSDPQVVSAKEINGVFTIQAEGVGVAKVTVTAHDPYNMHTGISFSITSRDENSEVDLYPLPVKKDGILNIRMGRYVQGEIQVTLRSLSGAKVYEQPVAISPDAAAQVDLSNLKPGNYQITIKHKQQEITRNITKL